MRRLGNDWYLLVLRAFLAFVFLYAGISKVADRSFLDGDDPASMKASVQAVRPISPLGGLLDVVADHATLFGILMAIGEIAVGLGILFGAFTRIAALGGMVLSASLWLTVSWGADPWFTSADLVYLFAFTPLLLHGAGDTPAVDGWFATVRARHPGVAEDRTRRTLVAGALAMLGGVLLGAGALFRGDKRHGTIVAPDEPPTSGAAPPTSPSSPDPRSPDPGTPTPTRSTAAASGPVLLKASDVPVGGAATASLSGDAVWVLQLEQDRFSAFDATCPHQGCEVQFVSAGDGFMCPCHQSRFDATGKVTHGPATENLTAVPVGTDGADVRAAK